MKAKKVQESDFDLKKWGLFFLFLAMLAVVLAVLLKPEGKAGAEEVLSRSRLLNRKAREVALKTNAPQDRANLDLSSDALEKANALFIESEFSQALDEANKAIRYSEKIINRGNAPTFGANIRFGELVGDVFVKKKASRDFEVATDRMTLHIGDQLRTNESGGCLLIHKDLTSTMIHPNTQLVIQEDFQRGNGQIALFLDEGAITVKTPGGSENRLSVLSPVGKTLIYHESEVTAGIVSGGNELELKVKLGRADAHAGKRSVFVSTNQVFRFSEQNFEGEASDLLAPPPLNSPVRSSKFSPNANGFSVVTMAWEAVSGASHYHVEVATDPLFVNKIEEKARFSGSSLTLPNIQAGTYYWRVTAIDRLDVRGITPDPLVFEVLTGRSETRLVGSGTPPRLEILDTVVQGHLVIVKGRTSRDAGIKLNGETTLVDKDSGLFNHVLKLPGYGMHKINVVAESSTGSIAFKNLSVEIKD